MAFVLTKVYQYAKEERFLFFEPFCTLVDICLELLLNLSIPLRIKEQ